MASPVLDVLAVREALLRDTKRGRFVHRWITDQHEAALDKHEYALDPLPSALGAPEDGHDSYEDVYKTFHQPLDAKDDMEREGVRLLLHEMRDWYVDEDERRYRDGRVFLTSSRAPSPAPSSSYSESPPDSPAMSPHIPYSSSSNYHSNHDNPDFTMSAPPGFISMRSNRPVCVDTANMPYLTTPSSPVNIAQTSYWSPPNSVRRLRTSKSVDSLRSVAKSFKSGRSLKFNVDLAKLKDLAPKTYWRKKLLIQGIPLEDEMGFESVKTWCEGFGSCRLSRQENGDIHVHFYKKSIADNVCRLNRMQVTIKGAGSVTLSHFTGRRPTA
ncbi:hypothetical protein BD410DRAFT_901417 [Rickenella mellea]|uniref:Uncharacterized protein n=1 Tax=Rickenella mellea TaxID=50990 RepID=A0A4Y7PR27_9AGAM|nr:hypothetical protein BD410DRAFT_901417 [Rickenella mellea]